MSLRPKPGIENRRNVRQLSRIECELYFAGSRHAGVVKDISRGGLFVQTRAQVPLGAPITLVFPRNEVRTEIRVVGRAVRTEQIGAHLETHGPGGIGMEVTEPGALGRLLADLRLTLSSSEPTELMPREASAAATTPTSPPQSAAPCSSHLEWPLSHNEVYHRPCMGWTDSLGTTKCGSCGAEFPESVSQQAGAERQRALRELQEKAKLLTKKVQGIQARAKTEAPLRRASEADRPPKTS